VQFAQFTPSGKPKLSEDVLETLDHPVARQATRLFKLTKHRKAYIAALQELADADGVVHCSIRALGARTGRMSVSRPPLQQLPRQQAIRDAFIPREGRSLILADYDQIEMRLLAHFSGDPTMIAAIRRGDELTAAGYDGWDLHSANARAIFGIPEGAPVPKDQRQASKQGGFAEVYGAGTNRFAMTMNVDIGVAAQFKAQYNATFPGVGEFKRRVERTLRERMPDPYLISPYGRIHRVDLQKAYKGTNYLIQGTAADVLKDRLVAMRHAGLGEFMTLPIHDEVMLDVPNDLVADVVHTLRSEMPLPDKFAVPLTVGVDVVDRWGTKYRSEG
jgi:DNA polymerase-1